jgi:LysR family glycine cleavage system transcriptional activator
LRTFEAAARHLSFKKAAAELHVTPAAISQQIKSLEDYLGQPLFHRLTRRLALTEAATAMLPKLREGFECLSEALDLVRRPDRDGLTITAPPSLASHWLVPRLSGFLADHPAVKLRLGSGSDNVDRPGQVVRIAAPDSGSLAAPAELAIRYGTGNYPGHQVDRIFSPDYVPVCRPDLAGAGHPLRLPADLAGQVLIHDETIDDGRHDSLWAEWWRLAGAPGPVPERAIRFSNAVLAIEAALAGQGVALALRPLVAADLAAGRLLAPFAVTVPSPYAYFLVIPPGVARRPAVVDFRDWLLAQAAD